MKRGIIVGLMVAGIALAGCGGGDADVAANDSLADPAAGTTGEARAGGDEVGTILEEYTLNMEDMKQWVAANQALERLAAEQPDITMELDEDVDSTLTLEQALEVTREKIESVPEIQAAVESAGLSVEQYTLISYAMMQASMAQYAVEQGADMDSLAGKLQMNPANLRFIQEHEAEIQQLTADMQVPEVESEH